jgi:hypothetical protein
VWYYSGTSSLQVANKDTTTRDNMRRQMQCRQSRKLRQIAGSKRVQLHVLFLLVLIIRYSPGLTRAVWDAHAVTLNPMFDSIFLMQFSSSFTVFS